VGVTKKISRFLDSASTKNQKLHGTNGFHSAVFKKSGGANTLFVLFDLIGSLLQLGLTVDV